MNKLLKVLADEAAQYSAASFLFSTKNGDELFLEKFAELIVRETLKEVRDEVQYEYDWKLADAVTERVLTHFGVLE